MTDLWDSWEDDAVIRDYPTSRFLDRDKLHYIDFSGTYFSVKGPSITPRPPQYVYQPEAARQAYPEIRVTSHQRVAPERILDHLASMSWIAAMRAMVSSPQLMSIN